MCRRSLRQFIENKCKTHAGEIVKNRRTSRMGGTVIRSEIIQEKFVKVEYINHQVLRLRCVPQIKRARVRHGNCEISELGTKRFHNL